MPLLEGNIDKVIALSGKSTENLLGEFGIEYTEATTLRDYLDNDIITHDGKAVVKQN